LRRTIRIRTWGGIGDVILATPAIAAIRQKYPTFRIVVYCTWETHFAVLYGNPHIDRLVQVPKRAPLATLAELGRAFMRWYSGRQELWAQLFRLSPNTFDQGHASDLIAHLLEVRLSGQRCQIFLTDCEQEWGAAQLAAHPNPVVLHAWCHQTVGKKNWSRAKWEAVVHDLPDCTFIQVGRATEPPVHGTIDLRGKTTLRQSFALVSQAKAFVGVDSAMAHAASAFGTPGVVLFGPSSSSAFGHPLHANIQAKLRCSPCLDEVAHCPCPYDGECMRLIEVDEVVDALKRQLAGESRFPSLHVRRSSDPGHDPLPNRLDVAEQRQRHLAELLRDELATHGAYKNRYLLFLKKELDVYSALTQEFTDVSAVGRPSLGLPASPRCNLHENTGA